MKAPAPLADADTDRGKLRIPMVAEGQAADGGVCELGSLHQSCTWNAGVLVMSYVARGDERREESSIKIAA
jgi:hypothetical protein